MWPFTSRTSLVHLAADREPRDQVQADVADIQRARDVLQRLSPPDAKAVVALVRAARVTHCWPGVKCIIDDVMERLPPT